MQWQPIETIEPGIATSYLLWDGERVYTGWRTIDGQWHCDQWADHCSEVDLPPTHWMPFPEPPQCS